MKIPIGVETANRAEAIGDWSDFKGGYYHILYAAWLVLSRAQTVTFYEGNDLLATSVGVSLDTWIQFKNYSETDKWGIYSLVRDRTLLKTFIRNALTSQANGRTWQVQLITSAKIDTQEIQNFLKNPDSIRQPPNRKGRSPLPHPKIVLQQIIVEAHHEWDPAPSFQIADVEKIAGEVLSQISECKQYSAANLKSALLIEVEARNSDIETVTQIYTSLVGVFKELASPEEFKSIELDINWLAKKSGHAELSNDVLFMDAISTCDLQIQNQLGRDWRPDRHVRRQAVSRVVGEFRESSEPFLFLVGESGVGKTWSLAHEATVKLQNSVRAFLPADSLLRKGVLEGIGREFAAFVPREVSNEEVLRRLSSLGLNPDVGHFTIFADDLGVHGTPAEDIRELVQIGREAQSRGLKIVMSMRLGVWNRLKHSRELAEMIYNPVQRMDYQSRPSIELIAFSEDEVHEVINRSDIPVRNKEKVSLWILRPQHVQFRNAYLLSIFINQYLSDGHEQGDLDELLNTEIDRSIVDIAGHTGIDLALCSGALSALTKLIWAQRRTGTRAEQAISELNRNVPGQGYSLLGALRTRDILAASGSLRAPDLAETAFANPLFFESCVIRFVLRDSSPTEFAKSLEPGSDDGVITMISRSLIKTELGAIQWAEELRDAERAWTPALCYGLSHRIGSSWRTISYLTSLANDSDVTCRLSGTEALGNMAYHSSKARTWIRKLYCSEHYFHSFIGRLVIGSSFSINPQWTIQVVREQVLNCIASVPPTRADFSKYADKVSNSLSPLRHLENSQAARYSVELIRLVKRVQKKFKSRWGNLERVTDDVLDQLRGANTVFRGDKALYGLTVDLRSKHELRRYRAARAARYTVFDMPDNVELRAAVLDGLSLERVRWFPFLSCTYVYTKRDVRLIGSSIERSGALTSSSGSLAFVVMGLVGLENGAEAQRLLPFDLSEFCPIAQMFLREPLAYARLLVSLASQTEARPREVLAELAQVRLMSRDKRFASFAIRGLAISQLSLILCDVPDCINEVIKSRVISHHNSEEYGDGFLYIEFDEVCLRYRKEIVSHAGFERLVELLLESINLAVNTFISPIARDLSEWQFRTENLCVNELSSLISEVQEPESILGQLPRSWHALRICTAALRANRKDDAFVQLGCQICDANLNDRTEVSRERDAFLLEIERRNLVPASFAKLHEKARRQPVANSIHFQEIAMSNTAALLDELHQKCMPDTAIEFTWAWAHGSTSWQLVLLGEVFIQSFNQSESSEQECLDRLAQILEVVSSLPDSKLKSDYLAILTSIQNFPNVSPELNGLELRTDSLLTSNLSLARQVLVSNIQDGAQLTEFELESNLAGSGGFVFDQSHWIEEGNVVSGFRRGTGTVWIPPIAALAITRIGLSQGNGDILARFYSRWNAIDAAFSSGSIDVTLSPYFESSEDEFKKEHLQKAAVEMRLLIEKMGVCRRTEFTLGHLLLLNHQFEESKDHLLTALSLPNLGNTKEEHILYELSCVYGRLVDAENCKKYLMILRSINSELLRNVFQDPDLQNFVAEPWFIEIAS